MDLLNLKHCTTSCLSDSKPVGNIKLIRKNNYILTMCSVYVLGDSEMYGPFITTFESEK